MKFSLDEFNFDLISVDLFDTVLIRNYKPEIQRLLEISDHQSSFIKNKYGKTISYKDLFFLRTDLFQTFIDLKGVENEKLPIKRVYEKINEILNVEPDSTSFPLEMERVEQECEILNLKVNYDLKQVLQSYKRNGKKVIYVSDMYLCKESLDKVLKHHGLEEVFDRGYVSSSLQHSKRNGDLYSYVKNHEDVEFEKILHIGDNTHSDIKKARAMGIQTLHIKPNKFNEVIKKILTLFQKVKLRYES